mgnify:CR=1 FL=1
MSKNKNKKESRINRLNSNKFRLSIFRSNKNINVQIIDDKNGITLVSANTQQLNIKGNSDAALKIGKLIAEKAKDNKIKNVYFDRKRYRYTGKIKLVCEAARENGLVF